MRGLLVRVRIWVSFWWVIVILGLGILAGVSFLKSAEDWVTSPESAVSKERLPNGWRLTVCKRVKREC